MTIILKKHSNGHNLLKTYFLSQDLGWHQLVLKFGTIEDRKNKSKRFKPKKYLFKQRAGVGISKSISKKLFNKF